MGKEKITRGNASQFFVAGELCRRGYSAVVTLGNTPNTDVLCSNLEGTKFVHIQVKTFMPRKNQTCSVGMKAEIDSGENFFWVIAGIPGPDDTSSFEYYIIPASVMAENVTYQHQTWLETPGKKGQQHKDSPVRTIDLPPYRSSYCWDISGYRDRWDLLEKGSSLLLTL
jgi:hypothetical protein